MHKFTRVAENVQNLKWQSEISIECELWGCWLRPSSHTICRLPIVSTNLQMSNTKLDIRERREREKNTNSIVWVLVHHRNVYVSISTWQNIMQSDHVLSFSTFRFKYFRSPHHTTVPKHCLIIFLYQNFCEFGYKIAQILVNCNFFFQLYPTTAILHSQIETREFKFLC